MGPEPEIDHIFPLPTPTPEILLLSSCPRRPETEESHSSKGTAHMSPKCFCPSPVPIYKGQLSWLSHHQAYAKLTEDVGSLHHRLKLCVSFGCLWLLTNPLLLTVATSSDEQRTEF